MRVLVQRVREASVKVEGRVTGAIGPGLLALVGIGLGDGEPEFDWMVQKLAGLRIFEDAEGKMNLSVEEVGGAVLAVSQFTLYADCRKGRRPSFTDAAPPEAGRAGFEAFVTRLRARGLPVGTGVFQAHMQVALVNDGPVTIMLESPPHS